MPAFAPVIVVPTSSGAAMREYLAICTWDKVAHGAVRVPAGLTQAWKLNSVI